MRSKNLRKNSNQYREYLKLYNSKQNLLITSNISVKNYSSERSNLNLKRDLSGNILLEKYLDKPLLSNKKRYSLLVNAFQFNNMFEEEKHELAINEFKTHQTAT
jgi:hypothetical protein